jgi:hypothetical protein
MKTLIFCRNPQMIFMASVVAVLCISACASGPSERGAFSCEIYIEEKQEPLFPEKGADSPTLSVRLNLAKPQNATLDSLSRKAIYDGKTAEEYGAILIKSNVEHYLAQRESESDLESEATWTWDYHEVVERLPAAALPTLVRRREYSTGGAHGNREKRYFVFDEKKGVMLSLDTLILQEGRARLNELVTEAVRRYAGVSAGRPLTEQGFFYDSIEAPENFFITESGISFHWDPYEIAPYVMGSIEISIRGNDAHDLLTEDYRKLLR